MGESSKHVHAFSIVCQEHQGHAEVCHNNKITSTNNNDDNYKHDSFISFRVLNNKRKSDEYRKVLRQGKERIDAESSKML